MKAYRYVFRKEKYLADTEHLKKFRQICMEDLNEIDGCYRDYSDKDEHTVFPAYLKTGGFLFIRGSWCDIYEIEENSNTADNTSKVTITGLDKLLNAIKTNESVYKVFFLNLADEGTILCPDTFGVLEPEESIVCHEGINCRECWQKYLEKEYEV